MNDLEEGEIDDNGGHEDRYHENVTPNNAIDNNQRPIVPKVRPNLDQIRDPLFGKNDTDLRFDRNYNDCDERLIGHNPSFQQDFSPNIEPNQQFLVTNEPKYNPIDACSRPPYVDPMPRFKDNRFDSFAYRQPMSSSYQHFANQRPYRNRSRIPLLPSPVMLSKFSPSNEPLFQPIRPSLVTRLNYPQHAINTSHSPVPTITGNYSAEDCSLNDIQSVIPHESHHSTIAIPFICDSNNIQIQTIAADNQKSEDSFDNKYNQFMNSLNSKTIVIETCNEIEEVEMSDQLIDRDLSPYDPEEDITKLIPLSPIMHNIDNGVNNNKINDKSLKSDSNVYYKKKENTKSDEQNKRLERLLKGIISPKKSKFSQSIKKPVRRGVTPLRDSKVKFSIHTKTEDLSISHNRKRNIHKICRNVGHKSRKKLNRLAKRQVITEFIDDCKQKSKENINDTSYEELLEEYKRIQQQLKELDYEEKNEETIVTLIDREEQENIDKFVKSGDDVYEMSGERKENDNKSDDQNEEEEEELELRRLALESKKKREIEEQESEELRLRQQLLQSLFRSKAKNEVQVNVKENKMINEGIDEEITLKSIDENCVIITETNETIKEPFIAVEVQLSSNLETEIITKTDQLFPKPIPKFIIYFGDDSTDEEPEMNEIVDNVPKGLDSFLRQARLKSETNSTANPQSLQIMSETKRRELDELKAEILRREQNLISDKKLKENENLWKSAKKRLEEKLSKRDLLKSRVTLKRNLLRKAQIQARKLHEAYIAAQRIVTETASEFRKFNEKLKNSEKDVEQENVSISNHQKECLRIGTKLKGKSYKLPKHLSVKEMSANSVVNKEKKESIAEKNLSKEEMAKHKKRLHRELVQNLEFYSKLLDLKKANLIRPASPLSIKPQTSNLDSLAKHIMKDISIDSLISLDCFLENMFTIDYNLNTNITIPDIGLNLSTKLNDKNNNCNLNDSVLSHLHSYRLTENPLNNISSDHWTNDLNPIQEICTFDLLGTCNDDKCFGQHISKIILSPSNKIVDLLLYDPEVAGVKTESTQKMNSGIYEGIRRKLDQFSQKLLKAKPNDSLETHCRRIADLIRKRLLKKKSNEDPVVCLLTRRIPKMFNTPKMNVPFDDLMYRFNIKDKSLVINQSKISELKLSADPDIYIKNRFFAPEGVPISAQLETTLAADPNNIQLWIKLAYYHISRCCEYNNDDSIDRALNVLSRALEHNQSEPELYEHYLYIYSNRTVRKGEDLKLNLNNICRKAVEYCPHYRVWKCVLSLFVSYTDKLNASNELLYKLINKSMLGISDLDIRSHQILETFLYKIHLNLQQNKIKDSLKEFSKALDNNDNENLENLSNELIDCDRVFAWLCYTYLMIYKHLPNHCFELTKQGFPQLINKNAFIFDWISLKDRFNLNDMKCHLIRATQQCHLNNKNSLAIHVNLAQLYSVYENDDKFFNDLLDSLKVNVIEWPLMINKRFTFKDNDMNSVLNFDESLSQPNKDIRIHLNAAKHYTSMGFISDAKNQLLIIASHFYMNCIINVNIMKPAFEALLLESHENEHNFELINCRKSKESNSPILWLSYILLLELDCCCERDIDLAFQTALALCSSDGINAKDVQLLWSNYLEYSMKHITNEKQFIDLFESVRHCCLTIKDSLFQSQVIRFLCQKLPPNEKSKALIQFAKLIPENINIMLTAICFSLEINQKERIWLLVNYLIFDKKIRIKCLDFWKIVIGLAIERRDHLSAHKLFQIAISLMPYNTILWQNLKLYETCIKHSEHIKQAKSVCEDHLKVPLII